MKEEAPYHFTGGIKGFVNLVGNKVKTNNTVTLCTILDPPVMEYARLKLKLAFEGLNLIYDQNQVSPGTKL